MRHVALSTVRRLSLYLQFLEECEREGKETVSSRALAELAFRPQFAVERGAAEAVAWYRQAGWL